MNVEDITKILNLSELETREWSIYKTSAISGEGLNDAFDWLVESINKNS